MKAEELIALAMRVGETEVETPTEALEVIYGHGMADEVESYEGQEPKSIVRVEEWLLHTDSQGFTDVEQCDSTEEAIRTVENFVAEGDPRPKRPAGSGSGTYIPDGLGCVEKVPSWMLDDAPPWKEC